ncbi:MAG: porin family protein [Henriciella sp.]
MQPHKLLLSAAMVAIVVLPQASAENFYAEGFASAFNTDEAAGVAGVSDLNFGTIGARGGYSFNENFSLEGELQTGLDDEEFAAFPVVTEISLQYNAAIFGRFSIPVSERLNLYGRIGYASTEFEFTSSLGEVSDSLDGGAYGLGASFDLTDKIYIRGDATRYDTGLLESDSLAIGAGLRF